MRGVARVADLLARCKTRGDHEFQAGETEAEGWARGIVAQESMSKAVKAIKTEIARRLRGSEFVSSQSAPMFQTRGDRGFVQGARKVLSSL